MNKRVLIATAVEAEKDAVLRGLQGADHVVVIAAGVGPAAAAASTARALAVADYDLVVSAGIGGGFIGLADVGSLVVASEIIAPDLGAQTSDGFCSLDQLGFGSARFPVEPSLVAQVKETLQLTGLPVTSGPILTVSTVTGTASTAAEMASRVPGAVAEAMEGYGVAVAAYQAGVPVLEIRSISNPVGPRDRANWRIQEALQSLEEASKVLMEVFK